MVMLPLQAQAADVYPSPEFGFAGSYADTTSLENGPAFFGGVEVLRILATRETPITALWQLLLQQRQATASGNVGTPNTDGQKMPTVALRVNITKGALST